MAPPPLTTLIWNLFSFAPVSPSCSVQFLFQGFLFQGPGCCVLTTYVSFIHLPTGTYIVSVDVLNCPDELCMLMEDLFVNEYLLSSLHGVADSLGHWKSLCLFWGLPAWLLLPVDLSAGAPWPPLCIEYFAILGISCHWLGCSSCLWVFLFNSLISHTIQFTHLKCII